MHSTQNATRKDFKIPLISKEPDAKSVKSNRVFDVQSNRRKSMDQEIHSQGGQRIQYLSAKKLIGLALERKNISDQYQANFYPSFLRSHGPFKVYDHA